MKQEVTASNSECGVAEPSHAARDPVAPMRVAVLIVCRDDFEPDRLARHLAEASEGMASVSLVPVEAVPGIALSKGSATDYAHSAARIWQHLQPRSASGGVGVCDAETLSGCNVAGCEQLCNQATAPCDAIPESDPQDAAPACDGRVNGSGPAQAAQDRPARARLDKPITVVSAAGNTVAAKRLLECLASEPEFIVLGEPIDEPDALPSYLRNRRPDLLVLDAAWLVRIGAASARIRRRFPGVRVLVFAEEFSSDLVEQILRNRFDGLLLTRCPPEACVKAALAVHGGELWLPRALLARAVAERLQAHEREDAQNGDVGEQLTARENQIVELLRRGYTNKEIGRQLGIMEDTVKKHLQSVFGKLGVHRRTLLALR